MLQKILKNKGKSMKFLDQEKRRQLLNERHS